MPNRKYANSAKRELTIKKEFEEKGWYAIRASGSHGIADVIALRPIKTSVNPNHFEAKFIQVKTSQSLKQKKVIPQAIDSACGLINVEFWHFPVKNAKFRALARKRKAKELTKKKKIKKS